MGTTSEYSAGATIFEKGQAGDMMYVVLEGEVEIRAHGQLLNTLGLGDLVGEMALIDSRPRSALHGFSAQTPKGAL